MFTTSLALTAATALEATINQALTLDPGSQLALQALEGKIIHLEITQPPLNIYLQLGYPLRVMSYWEGTWDCQLSGSAMAFFTLLRSGKTSLANTGVCHSGETGLLTQLLQLISQLDIDWEAPLVKLLGDLPGHGLASLIRRQLTWWRNQVDKTPFFIGDYLTQELGLIPSAEEINAFCEDVDELRAQAERLAARFALLQQKVDAQS